jgi:hypothetical protein
MDEIYFAAVILLSYTTIALIFGLCLFAYQCYEYKRCGTMLKWEYWFDFDKSMDIIGASILFPISIIIGLLYIPIYLIKKLFKVE